MLLFRFGDSSPGWKTYQLLRNNKPDAMTLFYVSAALFGFQLINILAQISIVISWVLLLPTIFFGLYVLARVLLGIDVSLHSKLVSRVEDHQLSPSELAILRVLVEQKGPVSEAELVNRIDFEDTLLKQSLVDLFQAKLVRENAHTVAVTWLGKKALSSKINRCTPKVQLKIKPI
mgnify:CR=1 FL=1